MTLSSFTYVPSRWCVLLCITVAFLPPSNAAGKITSKNRSNGDERAARQRVINTDDYSDVGNTQECINDYKTCNPFEDGNEFCHDTHSNCYIWAEKGECEANASYMLVSCRLSCELCVVTADRSCVDRDKTCTAWASQGECEKNPEFMLETCAFSCEQCLARQDVEESTKQSAEKNDSLLGLEFGVLQAVEVISEKSREMIRKVVHETAEYMETYIQNGNGDKFPETTILMNCHNKHRLCAYWVTQGECESNAEYMDLNCGPVCKSCEREKISIIRKHN